MKYTRYNYKNKNQSNIMLFIVLIGILITSLLLGTVLSNIFIKNSEGIIAEEPANTLKPEEIVEKKIEKYIAIQCGYFGKKENADELKSRLKDVVNPFYIYDNDKIRVMAGLLKEKEALEMVTLLKDKGFDSVKIVSEINVQDSVKSDITEVISASIDILNKLREKQVKSIKTEEFKKWSDSINNKDSYHKDYASLEALKKYIKELPDELTKEKSEEFYQYLYNILLQQK